MGSSGSKVEQPSTPLPVPETSPTTINRDNFLIVPSEAPPTLQRVQSFEEKLYDKVRNEDLCSRLVHIFLI